MTDSLSHTEQVTYLDDETTELVEEIDAFLLTWMRQSGARPSLPPPLVAVADLERIEYFRNFPQLANVVSTVRTGDGPVDAAALHGEQLNPADFAVPSAACYGIYVQYADSVLPGPGLRTARLACARAEDYYRRFRRMRAYYVREYVYLGTPDGARSFVDDVVAWLSVLIGEAGLDASIQSAADPFFEQDSSKAFLQRLSGVKKEVVYRGGLAVSSVNYHRNFFGESYGIRLPDGEYVQTACFGAGLERWAAMLLDHCGGNARNARALVESLHAKLTR